MLRWQVLFVHRDFYKKKQSFCILIISQGISQFFFQIIKYIQILCSLIPTFSLLFFASTCCFPGSSVACHCEGWWWPHHRLWPCSWSAGGQVEGGMFVGIDSPPGGCLMMFDPWKTPGFQAARILHVAFGKGAEVSCGGLVRMQWVEWYF